MCVNHHRVLEFTVNSVGLSSSTNFSRKIQGKKIIFTENGDHFSIAAGCRTTHIYITQAAVLLLPPPAHRSLQQTPAPQPPAH